MTHRTMRDFLAALEKKGLLRRIARPVDRMWEPAALAKWIYQALPAERRLGMFFEKVKGSDIPIVTAALGANAAAYARALGLEIDGINDAWIRACRNPIPPREIMMKALDLWKEIGLPDFEIPKRASLRIDRSWHARRTSPFQSNAAHRSTISLTCRLTRDQIDANLTEAREPAQTRASQKSKDVLRHPGIACRKFAHKHPAQLTG